MQKYMRHQLANWLGHLVIFNQKNGDRSRSLRKDSVGIS